MSSDGNPLQETTEPMAAPDKAVVEAGAERILVMAEAAAGHAGAAAEKAEEAAAAVAPASESWLSPPSSRSPKAKLKLESAALVGLGWLANPGSRAACMATAGAMHVRAATVAPARTGEPVAVAQAAFP
jgi:hypothetical protein